MISGLARGRGRTKETVTKNNERAYEVNLRERKKMGGKKKGRKKKKKERKKKGSRWLSDSATEAESLRHLWLKRKKYAGHFMPFAL